MTTLVVTTELDQKDPIQLTGDNYIISGTFSVDTGDYVTGGFAVTAAQLRLDTLDRVVIGTSSIINHRSYWVKADGKVKTFHKLTGDFLPTEHTQIAMTAHSIPFIAFGRKAA